MLSGAAVTPPKRLSHGPARYAGAGAALTAIGKSAAHPAPTLAAKAAAATAYFAGRNMKPPNPDNAKAHASQSNRLHFHSTLRMNFPHTNHGACCNKVTVWPDPYSAAAA